MSEHTDDTVSTEQEKLEPKKDPPPAQPQEQPWTPFQRYANSFHSAVTQI